VDGAVPERGGDDSRGSRGGGAVVSTVKEERDGLVPGCGGEGRVDGTISGHVNDVEAVGGCWRRGLGGVEEGVGNFGNLTTSRSKSSS
jgi:cytolysin (calcineurin-like family phosphatase)